MPAFATGLASAGSFGQVPSYWVSAAGWLNAHAGKQAVLVEPGAPFGQYLWGSPMDDVLQALTNVDYAERNLSVVGSAGNERLLDRDRPAARRRRRVGRPDRRCSPGWA